MTGFPLELDMAFWAVVAAAAVAGLVRGFSGFGTAMIVAPVAAAAYSPQVAVIVILIIETLPALPLVIPAMKRVSLTEISPVVAGYALLLPAGIFFLTAGEPTALRWFMSVVILIVVVLLWRGWQYKGPRTLPVRVATGGLSGFLGGATSLSGPPVILYWMALRTGAGNVRSNLLVYLTVVEIFSLIGFYVAGILTWPSIALGLACSPAFFAGLLLGARLFGLSSETTYRRVALSIVLVAAIASMPLLDGLRG